jgi:hypothetical protein
VQPASASAATSTTAIGVNLLIWMSSYSMMGERGLACVR